jgi:hypothetical protein
MTEGLLAIAAILIAMGWFAIGWTARGHENHKYAESRLRHLTRTEATQRGTQATYWPTEHAPDPPTIHIHLTAPSDNPPRANLALNPGESTQP